MQPTRNIVVFGATSAIAEAIIQEYANNQNYDNYFFLVARNNEKLKPIIKDILVRGAKNVYSEIVNLDDCNLHQKIIAKIQKQFKQIINIVIIAHGVLLDQQPLNKNPDQALANFHTNATSVLSLLMRWANVFEQQGHGKLVVISSVAADRGRAKMTTYSAAKTAIDRTAEALQGRFFETAVSITLIKPGYIKTPMTANMIQKGFLWSTPEEIAPEIVQAIDCKKTNLYIPKKWWFIMLLVKLMPAYFLNKLNI